MKTVRLDAPLEARLDKAVRLTGKPASQIIRDALEAHCNRLFKKESLRERWADMIGVVDSSQSPEFSNVSENTGEVFADLLMERHRMSE